MSHVSKLTPLNAKAPQQWIEVLRPSLFDVRQNCRHLFPFRLRALRAAVMERTLTAPASISRAPMTSIVSVLCFLSFGVLGLDGCGADSRIGASPDSGLGAR